MNNLISDENLPNRFFFHGHEWLMIGKMNNYYTRVLALPIVGTGKVVSFSPKWFSNKEMLDIFNALP